MNIKLLFFLKYDLLLGYNRVGIAKVNIGRKVEMFQLKVVLLYGFHRCERFCKFSWFLFLPL